MQYSTPVRNAMLDAVESTIGVSAKLRLYSGSVPANPAATIGAAVLLVEMALPSDWMAAASAGAKALLGSWSGVAAATGTPTFFRVWDSAGTSCGIQGTAGVGSGEINLNGTITSGQTITESSFTITEGNP
jgi:hypothetical protein